jgi:hypothetical protein
MQSWVEIEIICMLGSAIYFDINDLACCRVLDAQFDRQLKKIVVEEAGLGWAGLGGLKMQLGLSPLP